MNTMKLPTNEDVTHYIAAVRAELADLPPDDLDDLTGGLEADLSELVAESPSGLAGLASPQEYAAELRSAAGFPVRAESPTPTWWTQQQDVARTNLADLRAGHPWVAHVVDAAKDLRPAWWIVRGVMIAWLASKMMNFGGLFVLLVLPGVVGSVVLGRRRDELGNWLRWLVVAANIAAVVSLYGLAVSSVSSSSQYSSPVDMFGPGLIFDGTPSSNLYVYDRDGKPLSDVRIFTDQGEPVNLSQANYGTNGEPLRGPVDIYGHPWDNTFPVVTGQPPADPGTDPDVWNPPSAIPPLDPSAGATASPSTAPTGSPSATVATPGGAATTMPTTSPPVRPTSSLPVPTTTR